MEPNMVNDGFAPPASTVAAADCRTLVARLNQEESWLLDARDMQRYVQRIVPLLRAEDQAGQVRRVIVNYHADHKQVEALLQQQHPQHHAAWQSWTSQVLAILQKKGLHWSSDVAYDPEDVVQIAFTELVRSIKRFGYRSRFSTWAFQVIVQSAKRHVRARHAQKRTGVALSLDELARLSPADFALERRELNDDVLTRLLREQINTVLGEQPDQRLAHIFHLWAIEDRHIEEIGTLLELYPGQVRRLLFDARRLLCDHPAILTWFADEL